MIVAMKVSGNVVPVKVVGIRTVSGFNGRDKTIYACVNQKTGRDCKAESAAKFRYEIKFNEQPATLPMVKPEETLPELYGHRCYSSKVALSAAEIHSSPP